MMRVITFETNPKEYHDGLLKYTCEKNGFQLELLGIGDKWNGTKQKVFAYLEYLKGITSNDLVDYQHSLKYQSH